MFAPARPTTMPTITVSASGYLLVHHNTRLLGVCSTPERASAIIRAHQRTTERAYQREEAAAQHHAVCFAA